MQRKSQLAAEIGRAIKARRLTQEAAATLLGIDQSKISRITRGQFRGVSEAKLLELVTKLGHDVKIIVAPDRVTAALPQTTYSSQNPACFTVSAVRVMSVLLHSSRQPS